MASFQLLIDVLVNEFNLILEYEITILVSQKYL
jgi:hypothetical protein